jgi:hypothetical protein
MRKVSFVFSNIFPRKNGPPILKILAEWKQNDLIWPLFNQVKHIFKFNSLENLKERSCNRSPFCRILDENVKYSRIENSIKMASFKISLNLLLISAFFFGWEGLRKTSFFFFFLDYQEGKKWRRRKIFSFFFVCTCWNSSGVCIVTTWRPPPPYVLLCPLFFSCAQLPPKKKKVLWRISCCTLQSGAPMITEKHSKFL